MCAAFRCRVIVAVVAMGGCLQTKSEVAVKPVDINLNITGRLELVITDARRQAAEITGEKPKRTVRPEDIGLPPMPTPTSEVAGPDAMRTGQRLTFSIAPVGLSYVAEVSSDRQAQLIQQMATRHPQIEALLASQVVGESHTGVLVPRASLSASQQAVITAENADRTELYKPKSHAIHRVSGLTGDRRALVTTRPCHAPRGQGTISDVGLIGGSHVPRPGDVSLAHHGILRLDELPEFRRHAVPGLQPRPNRRVHPPDEVAGG